MDLVLDFDVDLGMVGLRWNLVFGSIPRNTVLM